VALGEGGETCQALSKARDFFLQVSDLAHGVPTVASGLIISLALVSIGILAAAKGQGLARAEHFAPCRLKQVVLFSQLSLELALPQCALL